MIKLFEQLEITSQDVKSNEDFYYGYDSELTWWKMQWGYVIDEEMQKYLPGKFTPEKFFKEVKAKLQRMKEHYQSQWDNKPQTTVAQILVLDKISSKEKEVCGN